MIERWRCKTQQIGDKHLLNYEPDLEKMQEYVAQVSKELMLKISMNEEKLILQSCTDDCLRRLRDSINEMLELRKPKSEVIE
jgi:hypothetical protein